ncbi:DUF2977 domain-containing protein [Mammaliicoccus sp. G-M31]|uniref:DUF2977 domain-containing protein n=1 Tax=Mammaliicoccus sp. G-M31 TaxID=2898690 RepID=UPI001EFA4A2F|nr:DUF2977 domain-containing protein [Mammaliicoccus sp. G-M31]
MLIQINSSNEIIAFANVGNLNNSIEVDNDMMPNDFFINFKPKKYKYEDEQIVLNENYTSSNDEQPIQPPSISMPGSDEELRKMFADMQVQLVQANMMVMQLSQQNAQLSQETVKLNYEIEKLKGVKEDGTGEKDGDVIPEV